MEHNLEKGTVSNRDVRIVMSVMSNEDVQIVLDQKKLEHGEEAVTSWSNF